MTTIRIKLPKIEDVTFTLEVEQDDQPVRGNAMVSGEDELDKKYEDEILERLNSGDVWAWASVCVTAHWKGINGVDCLSGCCYKNEEDFKKEGMYYEQMKKQAYDDLISKIEALK